jgi:hypothetical protein
VVSLEYLALEEFRPKMPFHAFLHEQIISAMVQVSGDV